MNCFRGFTSDNAGRSLGNIPDFAQEGHRILPLRTAQDSCGGDSKGAVFDPSCAARTGNSVPDRRMTPEDLKPPTFPEASSPLQPAAQQRNGSPAPAGAQDQTDNASPEAFLPDDPASQCAIQPAVCTASGVPGVEDDSAPAAPAAHADIAPPCASTSQQPEAVAQNQSQTQGQTQGQTQTCGPVAQPRIPGDKGDRILYDANGHAIQNAITQPDYGQQPKRIMGWIPNFRAVSAGARPTPPSFDEKFMLSTRNSFDYAAIIFNAVDSEFPYILKSYPQFGNGMSGYGDYYWHGFVDKTIGSYMTTTLIPTLTREDTRYYELGAGRWYVRAIYAYTRILITPNDAGQNTFNFSEIVGKGAAAGLGNLYYPASYISWTKTGQRWLVQVAIRDGGFNLFREFWPDIGKNILRVKPKSQ